MRFDFGLTGDPAPQIVNAVVESVDVRIKQVKGSQNGISGGLTVLVQPSSFANLLSLPVAMQKLEIEARIPWLEWLLTAGDAIIIADFGVEFGNYGRTGKARMSKKKAPYKVPSTFSGTIDNNFVTRAIDGAFPQIKEIIRRSL